MSTATMNLSFAELMDRKFSWTALTESLCHQSAGKLLLDMSAVNQLGLKETYALIQLLSWAELKSVSVGVVKYTDQHRRILQNAGFHLVLNFHMDLNTPVMTCSEVSDPDQTTLAFR